MTTRRRQPEHQQHHQQHHQQQQQQTPSTVEDAARNSPRGSTTSSDATETQGSPFTQHCEMEPSSNEAARGTAFLQHSNEAAPRHADPVGDNWGVQPEVVEQVLNNDDVWDAMVAHGGAYPSRLATTELFKVHVPPPYPGVQYRKSKDLNDTHPRYCRHGSTVAGNLEDNGQWLRIHADVYLPTSVGGIRTLQRLTTRNAVKQSSAKKNGISDQMQQSNQEQRCHTQFGNQSGHQRRCCVGVCCGCCRGPDPEVVIDSAMRQLSQKDDIACATLPTVVANAIRGPAFPERI
jgi:hypothetical protein